MKTKSATICLTPLKTQFPALKVLRCLRSEDHGGALVEMAVALPIMMIMLTGIFSFSMALYQKLQLAEAVSNAGRVLAAERGDTDPCQKTTNAIYAAAPGLSRNSLTLTYTLGSQSYSAGTISCPGAGGVANPYMVAGGTATITATYPCSLSVYGMKLASCSLGSQITEVVQ
jgi:Flp pilus assembly protein TadG